MVVCVNIGVVGDLAGKEQVLSRPCNTILVFLDWFKDYHS